MHPLYEWSSTEDFGGNTSFRLQIFSRMRTKMTSKTSKQTNKTTPTDGMGAGGRVSCSCRNVREALLGWVCASNGFFSGCARGRWQEEARETRGSRPPAFHSVSRRYSLATRAVTYSFRSRLSGITGTHTGRGGVALENYIPKARITKVLPAELKTTATATKTNCKI